MKHGRITTAALLGAALLLGVSAQADDKGGKHARGERHDSAAAQPAQQDGKAREAEHEKARFTKKERMALGEYAEAERQRKAKAGPPGLQKHGGLPPGLKKKAASGKALPPGWQKKIAPGEVMPREVYGIAEPLPKDVRSKLPPEPKGTVTVKVDDRIVRVYESTREIIDVLQ